MSTDEKRIARLEHAFVTLTEMAVRADERADEAQARADSFDEKLNALIEAQQQMAANLAALAIIVGETDRRLDRLAETVDRFIAGKGGQG